MLKTALFRNKVFQKEKFDDVYSDLDFALYKINDPIRSFYEKKLISMALKGINISEMVCLDIGCGHGVSTYFLSKYFKKVISIDFSKKALVTAHKVFDVNNVENTDILAGDIEALPMGNKSVDVVFFKDVLHHTPDPVLALKEMKRVSSGIVVGIEANGLSPQMCFLAHRFRHERGMLAMNKKYLESLLLQAGFSDVEIHEFGFFPYHLRVPDIFSNFMLHFIDKFETRLLRTSLRKYSNYLILNTD